MSDPKQSTALTPLKLYDNSRISDFRRCPRYYLFRHVYDWAPDTKAIALTFGSSWHAAMDVVWLNHKAPKKEFPDVVDQAYAAFVTTWTEGGLIHPDELGPDDLDELGARTPQNAQEMLYAYLDARQHIFTDASFELIDIEQPFAVPLDPNNSQLWYVGRLDKVFGYRRKVIIGEHKTSSSYKKDGPFRNDFIDSFAPNSQIDGYNYRLKMDYPEKAGGVWVDAALVHKQVHDGFKFIPVDRPENMIDGWLWETHFWIGEIEKNLEIYAARKDLDIPYLAAFPKNTGSCSNFGGCAFADICRTVSNPAKLSGPPLGYKIEHWSPWKEIALEKIGFTVERTGENFSLPHDTPSQQEPRLETPLDDDSSA